MNFRARIAGYATVLAVLILAGWIGATLVREALHPNRIIQVRFPDLGTLKAEDPVVQNGVPIGQIKRLKLQDGFPVAEIELFRRDFIPADSRFVDFNHSLMGARMVVLRPGHSPLPMDENKIQEGFFADGIAERIRRVNGLMAQVLDVRARTNQLFMGPQAPFSPEFFARLEQDAAKLNAIAQQVDQTGSALRAGFQNLNRTGNSLRAGLHSTSRIDTAEQAAARMLKAALSAEQNADLILTSAETLLNRVQDSSEGSGGMAHALLSSRKTYDDLETSLHVLQTALNVLQKKGMADVVTWRNIHFFNSKSP